MNKKTLVFGASLKSERYANMAMRRLVNAEHEVVAFGLRKGEVAGVAIDNSLLDYSDIDTVTLYLGARHQSAYYEYIISLNPKRVIFNPGTENPEFQELLNQHQIEFENACTLVLLGINQY
ncbi:MAG: CoA-binding protein [Flavobacteriaceae bacterium]|nr:CoA-binding protein [Flavobacteriaceae bacterium]